ncbi:hypothetical protein FQA39_LY07555 [Lamprigera yunnana]|nr:hypothetical protein FQA39_LY07555 [Lamprigera yunnana]
MKNMKDKYIFNKLKDLEYAYDICLVTANKQHMQKRKLSQIFGIILDIRSEYTYTGGLASCGQIAAVYWVEIVDETLNLVHIDKPKLLCPWFEMLFPFSHYIFEHTSCAVEGRLEEELKARIARRSSSSKTVAKHKLNYQHKPEGGKEDIETSESEAVPSSQSDYDIQEILDSDSDENTPHEPGVGK